MKLLSALFFLLLVQACGNSMELKKEPSFGFLDSFPVQATDFAMIRDEILLPHCTQCHSHYSEYKVVFDQKDRILSAVLGNRMPKNAPALGDELKAMLNAWIESGAIESVPSRRGE